MKVFPTLVNYTCQREDILCEQHAALKLLKDKSHKLKHDKCMILVPLFEPVMQQIRRKCSYSRGK